MNSFDFLLAFGYIDQEVVQRAIEYVQPDKSRISKKRNTRVGEGTAKYQHKRFGKTLMIAAVIVALFAAMCAAAYAFNWFGLSSLLTPTENPYPQPSEATSQAAANGGWVAANGFAWSDEALASIAWNKEYWDVTQEGDLNDAEINAWRSSLNGYAAEAIIYNCFNQKMLNRLLEIKDEYGLRLHNETAHPMTQDLFCRATGLQNFLLTDNATWSSHYVFEDGSFKLEGTYDSEGKGLTFSINRSAAGVLAPYGMYVSSPESYDEWQLETDGHILNLALRQTELGAGGMVFMQEGDNYITIGFNTMDSLTLEREEVESFALSFDYSILCGGQPDLSVINGMTAVEVRPKNGLFTMEDYLNTPEYLAGSAFQHAYGDWFDAQIHYDSYVKGQYMVFHYAPFPTGVAELDELLGNMQSQYSLKMPTNAVCILGGDYIPAERATSLFSYSTKPGGEKHEDVILGHATEEDYWALMETDNFLLSDESDLFSLAKWDNGVWQCAVVYGSTSYELVYVPKGSFCPVLRESLHPDAIGWAYDTACGEQVYICLDGDMVYPRFPSPVVLYETDAAYVILSYSGGNVDAGKMQMFADNIDFSKFN